MFFGVVNNDGCSACDIPLCYCGGAPTPTPEYDDQGRRVFTKILGRFLLVVEAKPGSNHQAVCPLAPAPNSCVGLSPDDPTVAPDLQIETTQPLGNGDPVVDCQSGQPPAMWGGITAIPTPSFDSTPATIAALQDFACRFTALNSGTPCTLDGNANTATVSSDATIQFCNQVAMSAAFPQGDTVLTAQIVDRNQNLGPTAQIVVRVVTPTPTPPF